ncbi:unnamed protein product [Phytophthora fragariaefolia]|uniref:Unnamed protein product n=1 Tax=Phytophthora fragariaefolia TaxID=1490495 RepID=A0A9W6XRV8_9STRA|nr:unnamed protein product [Phytophthora fragariaefolia]
MFKPDIDSDLMAEIVEVLVASWRQKGTDVNPEEPTRTTFALAMLDALSQTARLALILDFFEAHQSKNVRELFMLMETGDDLSKEDAEVLVNLKQMFRLG